MPRRSATPRSDLARLWQQYAPLLGAALAALGFGMRAVQMYDAHREADRVRDLRLSVIEHIITTEMPNRTLDIDWSVYQP